MKYFCTLALSLLVSIFTYQFAEKTIENYLVYQNLLEYEIHNLDVIAVMLGSTDMDVYPFLSLQSFSSIIPTFSFYIIGTLVAIWRFIIIERGYHAFLLSRLQTKENFLKYLQVGINKIIILYCVSYTGFTLLFTYFLAPYPEQVMSGKDTIMLAIFTLSRIMMLAAIAQLAFIIYLKHNAIFTQYFSLFCILFCLIIGMNFDVVNFVFYNPQYYYLPSILVGSLIYISTVITKKRLTYQLVEKE